MTYKKINTIIGVSGKMRHGKDTVCDLLINAAKQRGYTKIVRRAFADALKEECADFMRRLFADQLVILPGAVDTVTAHKRVYEELGALIPTDGINICDTEGSELLLDWFINDLPFYVTQFGAGPIDLGVILYPENSGWIATFNHPQSKPLFRKLLQWWGTEYRRNLFGDSYWLNRMEDFITLQEPGTIVIAPDTRFVNEAEFIRHWPNGFTIRVHRPGMDDSNTHISETGLDDYRHFNLIIENRRGLQDLEHSVYHAWRLYEQYQGHGNLTDKDWRGTGVTVCGEWPS